MAKKRTESQKRGAPAVEESACAGKKVRIIPLVKRNPVDAESSIRLLVGAIDQVFDCNASGLSFEELYRCAYNLAHQRGESLYTAVQEKLSARVASFRDEVSAAPDMVVLLELLNCKWIVFSKALQVISSIFSHVDRGYVMQFNKQPIQEAGTTLWNNELVMSSAIRYRMTDALMEQVHRERKGETIDRGLMRNLINMLRHLGNYTYTSVFENELLRTTSQFYSVEGQQLLLCADCSEILKAAEKRIKEENSRAAYHLSEWTKSQVDGIVRHHLIAQNMKHLVDTGLGSMLQQDRHDDLTRMYELLHRVASGVETIREALVSHVVQNGTQVVQDPERQKDPVAFIQLLLDFKIKYDTIIGSSFANDRKLSDALNVAFEKFINMNASLPEFLSLFVDNKMRQGLSRCSEQETEDLLDRILVLFKYLHEKDMFEKYYKYHLAKRLISNKSMEEEAEKSVILKMKAICGYQFTVKLENMFNDMKMSKEIMQGFNSWMSSMQPTPSIHVQVLTTGSWPAYPPAKCILPKEVEALCIKFKEFYFMKHQGRRLTWQNSLGTADLKLTVGGTEKQLNVTTYQMCILMLFNESDQLSYKQIEEATDIPASDLKRNLQSLALVKGKNILRKEPMSKEINETDEFIFNDKFTSKLTKIRICTVAAQKESQAENRETRQRVTEDRKPQIEAAIVRVMKSRQVMEHNHLVSEVIKQLQARFMPNPSDIKRRIEALIEREFLERDKDNVRGYRYLA